MLENLSLRVFSEVANSQFLIHAGASSPVQFELVEITDLGSSEAVEQFSLVFLCRNPAVLPQQIYPVEHEKLGSFELFLVPIRKDASGVYYEAVFNRNRA